MPNRSLLVSATASLAFAATPASAQGTPVDQRYENVGNYEGEWDGAWEDADTRSGTFDGTFTDLRGHAVEAGFEGTWIGDDRFLTDEGRMLYRRDDKGWYEDGLGRGDHMVERRVIRRTLPRRNRHAGPVLGYSPAEREAWLAQCIALHDYDSYAYYEEYDDDDTDGGILGGVLGAVIGGVAGNRIADGDRLAGTLVGAGVGGIAGAVIGSAIDRDHDRYDDRYGDYYRDPRYDTAAYYANYCEAYLQNYERGYGTPSFAHAQPVMLMATPTRDEPMRQVRMTEEDVMAPREEPAPRIRRAIAPRSDKTLPIK